jgi:ABC-2 type transport system ATP-binding protein
MNAVEVTHLSRKFKDFSAINDVSFYIPQGEIFGLLGPNGAGKTTTIRVLCGIMLPSSGSANVLGYDVVHNPEEIKSRIGYMSQKFSLYNDLTPVENIMFYASIYGVPKKERAERVKELINMADLSGHERQLTRNLSGAWRQRLALACAIVHRPAMIFLDEATAGVDPVSRREFWDLIYGLASDGVSVLATTHYMDEAEYCNTIGMMYQGQLVALASPETLKNNLPGVLVQLECSQPGEALTTITKQPGIMGAAIHGALVHLTMQDISLEQQIKEALANAKVKIKAWDIIQPSLEDVFISMVSEQLSTADLQAEKNKRREA